MSNTVSFPNKERIEQQAAGWLAAIDRGLDDAEKQALDDWLAESPHNGETLVYFAGHWDKMEMLSAVARVLPLDSDNKSIGLGNTALLNGPNTHAMQRYWIWGLSSAALVVFGLVFLFATLSGGGSIFDKPETHYSAVYQTAIGDQSNISLPDGSELTLNTNTEVRIHFTESLREINLIRGEVFFDVAKNTEVPFVALVGSDTVTAVGTAFNIERKDSSVFEVLVTEGVVKVSKQHLSNDENTSTVIDEVAEMVEPVFLEVGEQVVVSRETINAVHTPKPEKIEAGLAWREGMLVFEGETLERALEEISRYTSLALVIEDATIKDIEVGGYFKAGDMDELLIVLESNFGIHYRQLGNQLLLSAQ